MKSLKSKWLVPYICLLVISILVSVLFGFYMVRESMYENLGNTEQQRLDVKVKNFYEQYDNSSLKFSTLLNDKVLKTPFDHTSTREVLEYTEMAVKQIKPFMYVNKEFENIFLINEGWIIGASKNERYLSKLETDSKAILTEDEIRKFVASTKMNTRPIYEDNMLITRLSDTAYLVAVLDFEAYFHQKEGDIQLLDLDGNLIFCKKDNQKDFFISEEIFGQYEHNSYSSYKSEGYLYTYVKDYRNRLFIIRHATEALTLELQSILRTLIVFSMVISLIFIGFAFLYVNNLIRPLDQFIALINRQTKVDSKVIEDTLSSKIIVNRNLTISLRIFYLTVLIPFISVNTFMLFTLKANVKDNIIHSQKQITQEWVKHIDNEIDAYQDTLQFLSIDQDIQTMIMGQDTLNSDEINYTLVSKGLFGNGFVYTEIGKSDEGVLFKNHPLRLKSNEKKWHKASGALLKNGSIEYLLEVGEDTSILNLSKPIITIKGENGPNAFDKIGYITISIEGFIKNHFFIEDSFPIDVLTISNKNNKTIYEFNNNSKEELVHVSGDIESLGLMVNYGFRITTSEFEGKMLQFYLLTLLLISFLLYIVAEVTSYRLIRPLASLIEQMDEISSYDVKQLVSHENSNEFYLLAHSFSKMMTRLEKMSENLVSTTTQKNDLEKRHTSLLLTSIEAQVSPHFLHNIIVSIICLVRADKKDEAVYMLLETSEFFKKSLYGTKSLVNLEEEISQIENYIKIQQIRYPDKINVINEIPKSRYQDKVPKFMLQPLIENAIEHGMRSQDPLTIRLNAYIEEENLYLTVEDDGIGIKEEDKEEIYARMDNINNTKSHGLANIHQRIKLVYGEASGITIKSTEKGAMIILKMSLGG